MAQQKGQRGQSVSAGLIAHILRDLGHVVPDDRELEELLQRASDEVKREQGLDPDKFEFLLTPFEKEWADQYIETRGGQASRPGKDKPFTDKDMSEKG